MVSGEIIELRKNYKRNKILNVIRFNDEVSRSKIRELTGYSMTTVINSVEKLVENKLIYEEKSEYSGVGRKPIWLKINPDGAYFIGMEFNADNMYCVILNFDTEVIYSNKISLQNNISLEKLLRIMTDSINKAIDFINDKGKIIAIGMGLPGYYDKEKGIGVYYPHLQCWDNVYIKKYLKKHFDFKVYIENNVNCMALAYKWLWYEGEAEDLLFLSIRTGIRMSCMLNNKLYLGKNGTAGEIGHLQVSGSNRLCFCGKKGCLDAEVSEEAIINKILEGIKIGKFQGILNRVGEEANIEIEDFIEQVKSGDDDAILLLEESAIYLGEALTAAINLFNPDKLVLSGKIFNTGEIFLDKIKEIIKQHAIFINCQDLIIETSTFKENIGAIGAVALVMQEEFEIIDKPV